MIAAPLLKNSLLKTSSICIHTTPLGEMWSHWTDRGLYRLGWDQPNVEEIDRESLSLSADMRQQMELFDQYLEDFFRDGRESFLQIKVDSTGWTPFQKRVYQQCRLIRAGSTRTYKQLAAMAGSEKASRAVGAAMARNRVPLVIPCHRVVSAGGSLRGFSAPGGLDTKRFLLDLERPTLL